MKLNQVGSNQTEIEIGGNVVLFSYKTPVAANVAGKFYRTATRHSVTTSRHINQWLEGREAEIKPQEFFDRLTV